MHSGEDTTHLVHVDEFEPRGDLGSGAQVTAGVEHGGTQHGTKMAQLAVAQQALAGTGDVGSTGTVPWRVCSSQVPSSSASQYSGARQPWALTWAQPSLSQSSWRA